MSAQVLRGACLRDVRWVMLLHRSVATSVHPLSVNNREDAATTFDTSKKLDYVGTLGANMQLTRIHPPSTKLAVCRLLICKVSRSSPPILTFSIIKFYEGKLAHEYIF
jgi:hypothetical protein